MSGRKAALRAFARAEDRSDFKELLVAPDSEVDSIARSHCCDDAGEVGRFLKRIAVYRGEYVARLNSDAGRRAAGRGTVEDSP
jgi:hypothetical protein